MDKGTLDATNMINSFIMIDKLSENGWELFSGSHEVWSNQNRSK
jgi:hypothetical protein